MNKIIKLYKKNISSKKYEFFIGNEIIKRTLDHLEYINIKPVNILILEYDKNMVNQLKNLYTKSTIKEVFFGRGNEKFFYCKNTKKKINDNEIDIVMINLSLNWINGFACLLKEIKRVSKENSILLFTIINYLKVNKLVLKNQILDNQKIGNMLSKHNFINLVIDNSTLKLEYVSHKKFFLDIAPSGLFFFGNININKLLFPITSQININFGYCIIKKNYN